jgi:hypothetical protein
MVLLPLKLIMSRKIANETDESQSSYVGVRSSGVSVSKHKTIELSKHKTTETREKGYQVRLRKAGALGERDFQQEAVDKRIAFKDSARRKKTDGRLVGHQRPKAAVFGDGKQKAYWKLGWGDNSALFQQHGKSTSSLSGAKTTELIRELGNRGASELSSARNTQRLSNSGLVLKTSPGPPSSVTTDAGKQIAVSEKTAWNLRDQFGWDVDMANVDSAELTEAEKEMIFAHRLNQNKDIALPGSTNARLGIQVPSPARDYKKARWRTVIQSGGVDEEAVIDRNLGVFSKRDAVRKALKKEITKLSGRYAREEALHSNMFTVEEMSKIFPECTLSTVTGYNRRHRRSIDHALAGVFNRGLCKCGSVHVGHVDLGEEFCYNATWYDSCVVTSLVDAVDASTDGGKGLSLCKNPQNIGKVAGGTQAKRRAAKHELLQGLRDMTRKTALMAKWNVRSQQYNRFVAQLANGRFAVPLDRVVDVIAGITDRKMTIHSATKCEEVNRWLGPTTQQALGNRARLPPDAWQPEAEMIILDVDGVGSQIGTSWYHMAAVRRGGQHITSADRSSASNSLAPGSGGSSSLPHPPSHPPSQTLTGPNGPTTPTGGSTPGRLPTGPTSSAGGSAVPPTAGTPAPAVPGNSQLPGPDPTEELLRGVRRFLTHSFLMGSDPTAASDRAAQAELAVRLEAGVTPSTGAEYWQTLVASMELSVVAEQVRRRQRVRKEMWEKWLEGGNWWLMGEMFRGLSLFLEMSCFCAQGERNAGKKWARWLTILACLYLTVFAAWHALQLEGMIVSWDYVLLDLWWVVTFSWVIESFTILIVVFRDIRYAVWIERWASRVRRMLSVARSGANTVVSGAVAELSHSVDVSVRLQRGLTLSVVFPAVAHLCGRIISWSVVSVVCRHVRED